MHTGCKQRCPNSKRAMQQEDETKSVSAHRQGVQRMNPSTAVSHATCRGCYVCCHSKCCCCCCGCFNHGACSCSTYPTTDMVLAVQATLGPGGRAACSSTRQSLRGQPYTQEQSCWKLCAKLPLHMARHSALRCDAATRAACAWCRRSNRAAAAASASNEPGAHGRARSQQAGDTMLLVMDRTDSAQHAGACRGAVGLKAAMTVVYLLHSITHAAAVSKEQTVRMQSLPCELSLARSKQMLYQGWWTPQPRSRLIQKQLGPPAVRLQGIRLMSCWFIYKNKACCKARMQKLSSRRIPSLWAARLLRGDLKPVLAASKPFAYD
jgi:hypothetical protein